MSSELSSDDILPGDIVALKAGSNARREGLVVGSHIDYAGRQIIEVQLDGEYYHAWYPTVTRIKRTVQYSRPTLPRYPHQRTIERRIYW